MADELVPEDRLVAVEALVDGWLAAEQATNPAVAAVERDPQRALRRWYVRLRGEQKDVFTLWLTLGQRTLQWETYVLPAPEENHALFYEHLLRRNRTFNGMAFAIGEEDAVFLVGQLPVGAVDEGELDRILGETWAYVEQCFRPALRIGFASRFNASH
ncbi:MAG: YbjN domain-containing protein [Acidimicrobiales bacterium]|jgi:hypothetical protein|nr:YbjN domain-containing protein [Acidimicrobiales bacterium]